MKKKICVLSLILFTIFSINSAFAQWVQTNGPYAGSVADCLATSGTKLYAGIDGGGVFVSDDSGKTWNALNSGLLDKLINAVAADGDTLLAASSNGVSLSTNDGAIWIPDTSGLNTSNPILCAAFVDSMFFVGSANERISRSTNFGSTWVQVHSGPYLNWNISCFAANGKTLFAGELRGLLRSTDYGTTWALIDSNNSVSSLLVKKGILYQANEYGRGVFVSSDNGNSWSWPDSGLNDKYVSSLAAVDSDVFAGTYYGGGVFRSTNDGTTWKAVNSGLTNLWIYGLATIGSNLFAATGDGIFVSTDRGTSWTPAFLRASGTSVTSMTTFGGKLFAATNGGIFFSSDQGADWTSCNLGIPSFHTYDIVADGSNLFATCDSGLYESTDAGTQWFSPDTAIKSHPSQLIVKGSDMYMLAGHIYRSSDGGKSWTVIDSVLPSPFVSTMLVTDSALYVAGAGIFRSTDDGKTWAEIDAGVSGTVQALFLGSKYLLAGTSTDMFSSSDDGVTWTNVPNMVTGITGVHVFAGSGNYIYAGSDQGVLYSWNEGQSWGAAQLANTSVYSLAIQDAFLFAGTANYPIGEGVWRQQLSGFVDRINDATPMTPPHFLLEQNYPNPFNPTTVITYDIAKRSRVSLKVYDVLGREVATLINAEKSPGQYQATFNGSDLPSGVYFYRIHAGNYTAVKKLLLLK